jgi:hypothetical protein
LCQALADAVAKHAACERELLAAEEAHRRSEDHRRRCQTKLSEFLSLDEEVTRSTKDALKAGADPKLSDVLANKIQARAEAAVALHGAETALAELLSEMRRPDCPSLRLR